MESENLVSVPPDQTGSSSQVAWPQLAAGTSLVVGGLLATMGLAHLASVIVAATMRSYVYNFRLAALLLVGTSSRPRYASWRCAVSSAVSGLPGVAP